MNIKKILAIGVVALVGAFATVGCGRTHTITGPTDTVTVHETVYVKKAQVNFKTVLGSSGREVGLPKMGLLAKSSAISLDKLVLTFTSSALDTVRDTLTTSTTPSISATSTSPQVINKNYTLAPLRTWKLVAKTLDTRDSVIHMDSVTTSQLNPADTVDINLSMTSKFQMYEANFLTLPDSISSSAMGTGKDIIQFKRLKMILDSGTANEVVVDSVSPTFFTALASHKLSHDYVTPGNHTVKLYAYGSLHGVAFPNHLYYVSSNINVAAGVDNTTPLTLNWVGPTTGTGSMEVTLGKVGKVTVNGTLPGSVIP